MSAHAKGKEVKALGLLAALTALRLPPRYLYSDELAGERQDVDSDDDAAAHPDATTSNCGEKVDVVGNAISVLVFHEAGDTSVSIPLDLIEAAWKSDTHWQVLARGEARRRNPVLDPSVRPRPASELSVTRFGAYTKGSVRVRSWPS